MTASPSPPVAPRDFEVRDRIFASALRHFSRKGFAATSLREISDDALTTKPMIYYYFGSKEGLYGSIVRQILEAMAEFIRHGLQPAAPFPQRVYAYCDSYMDYFMAQEEIIALVLREVFGLGGLPMAALSQTLGQQVRQPLDEILAQGMDSGAFRRDEVECCATAITGIMNMFILAHVFGGAPIHPQAPLQQVRHFVHGLTQKP